MDVPSENSQPDCEPTRSVGALPGCAFFWLLFFAQAKKSDSRLRSRSESLCFQALASAAFSKEKKFQLQEQELSLSFGERVTSLCLCKEKVTKRKHTLPPRPTRYARRVHSAAGIFRRDIPVSSKNDVHPCTSPLTGSCPSAPSLRKGTRTSKAWSNSRSKSRATATATATATTSRLPLLIPNPSFVEAAR